MVKINGRNKKIYSSLKGQLIKTFFKQQKNAAFIDVYNAMLDKKGNMREEIYLPDRLHMKAEGYAIWKKIILPYLIK